MKKEKEKGRYFRNRNILVAERILEGFSVDGEAKLLLFPLLDEF